MFKKFISVWVMLFFIISSVTPPNASAQTTPAFLNLPAPGTMLTATAAYNPPVIMGVNLRPEDSLMFDFIIDKGDSGLEGEEFNDEANKLIKYFLAALTTPQEHMWVNLSPYESGRIIPEVFGRTEMGRDMLAQDYILKQLSASLLSPQEALGEKFWNRFQTQAQAKFGTSEVPLSVFNKIWIVPEVASIFEHAKGAYIVDSKLKVMLEQDYLALDVNRNSTEHGLGAMTDSDLNQITGTAAEIIREVLLPEIEREVNEGRLFAPLRQIFHSMLLAKWYKDNLKESLLGQVYADQSKTAGVDTDPSANQHIYDAYLKAFETGAYNYMKEEYDPATQSIIPKKYFSGGASAAMLSINKLPVKETKEGDQIKPFNDPMGEIVRVESRIIAEKGREKTPSEVVDQIRNRYPQNSNQAMLASELAEGLENMASDDREVQLRGELEKIKDGKDGLLERLTSNPSQEITHDGLIRMIRDTYISKMDSPKPASGLTLENVTDLFNAYNQSFTYLNLEQNLQVTARGFWDFYAFVTSSADADSADEAMLTLEKNASGKYSIPEGMPLREVAEQMLVFVGFRGPSFERILGFRTDMGEEYGRFTRSDIVESLGSYLDGTPEQIEEIAQMYEVARAENISSTLNDFLKGDWYRGKVKEVNYIRVIPRMGRPVRESSREFVTLRNGSFMPLQSYRNFREALKNMIATRSQNTPLLMEGLNTISQNRTYRGDMVELENAVGRFGIELNDRKFLDVVSSDLQFDSLGTPYLRDEYTSKQETVSVFYRQDPYPEDMSPDVRLALTMDLRDLVDRGGAQARDLQRLRLAAESGLLHRTDPNFENWIGMQWYNNLGLFQPNIASLLMEILDEEGNITSDRAMTVQAPTIDRARQIFDNYRQYFDAELKNARFTDRSDQERDDELTTIEVEAEKILNQARDMINNQSEASRDLTTDQRLARLNDLINAFRGVQKRLDGMEDRDDYASIDGYYTLDGQRVSNNDQLGGIDFNPDAVKMQVFNDGEGFTVIPPSLAEIEQFMNNNGFVPVIINVQPVVNLPMLLGMAEDDAPPPSATGVISRL